MNDTIALRTRPMMPEEVLARLRNSVEPREAADIKPDALIEDLALMVTDDLKCWTARSEVRELGRLLEIAFSIRLDDWESEWLPPARRTVGELCERIAESAECVEPQPVTLLGRPCLSAGTFLTLRTLLARAGVESNQIMPSTHLFPYLHNSSRPLYLVLYQLAPGLVYDLRWPTPSEVRLVLGAMVVGAVASFLTIAGLWWPCAGICGLGFSIWMWRLEPKIVRHRALGPLVTFRDLTRAVLYHRNVTQSPTGTAP